MIISKKSRYKTHRLLQIKCWVDCKVPYKRSCNKRAWIRKARKLQTVILMPTFWLFCMLINCIPIQKPLEELRDAKDESQKHMTMIWDLRSWWLNKRFCTRVISFSLFLSLSLFVNWLHTTFDTLQTQPKPKHSSNCLSFERISALLSTYHVIDKTSEMSHEWKPSIYDDFVDDTFQTGRVV